jgi:Skp family chaperone for outer membrane proteins
MTAKRLPFDTLEYATLLKEKGVANAEAHAASLAAVIVQNLYTKDEVDKMIEAALQRFDERTRTSEKEFKEILLRFDERTRTSEKEFKEATHRLEVELYRLDKNIERTGSRTIYTTVSILGALIAVVGAAATFTHYFVH